MWAFCLRYCSCSCFRYARSVSMIVWFSEKVKIEWKKRESVCLAINCLARRSQFANDSTKFGFMEIKMRKERKKEEKKHTSNCGRVSFFPGGVSWAERKYCMRTKLIKPFIWFVYFWFLISLVEIYAYNNNHLWISCCLANCRWKWIGKARARRIIECCCDSINIGKINDNNHSGEWGRTY